jgi:hypothetical protein
LETKGIEQTAFSPPKTLISQTDSTKSGTLNNHFIEKYPELQEIISAWPELPEHIKTAIKALVESA